MGMHSQQGDAGKQKIFFGMALPCGQLFDVAVDISSFPLDC